MNYNLYRTVSQQKPFQKGDLVTYNNGEIYMVFDDIGALVEEAMKPMQAMSDAEYNAYWVEREKMKALVPLYEKVSALDFDCEITKTLCKRCREEHGLEDIDVECVIYSNLLFPLHRNLEYLYV